MFKNLRPLISFAFFSLLAITLNSCTETLVKKNKEEFTLSMSIISYNAAEDCAKLEKKLGRIPTTDDYYFQDTEPFKPYQKRVKCGGFVDKCHYRVIWYKKYNSGKEEVFRELILDICNKEKK